MNKRNKARRQVIEEGVVQVGALRGQRGANGARRGSKTKIRTYIPAPHTFLNSFGRAAKSKLWPIRCWDGEGISNPEYVFEHKKEQL